MSKREYQLVLFGSTGFTGGLTAEYLAARAPAGLRWALAGRDQARLQAVRTKLTAINADCASLPLLEADAGNAEQLNQLARSTVAVITTVGPYVQHGEPLAAACAAHGTHYADLTGEPEFVARLRAEHDKAARKSGARIVNCCGFDSIPHDFGALFTVRQLPTNVPVVMRGYVRAGGNISGGTWQSAVMAMSRWRELRSATARLAGRSRPGAGRRVSALPARPHRVRELGKWAAPFPSIDPQVIRRSAREMGEYGPDFRYGHFVLSSHLHRLVIGGAAVGAIAVGAQFALTRKLLLGMRKSGDGPSEAERERGWFTITFVASGGANKVVTTVSGGDPGYGDTAKMLAESGLCLALDSQRLPDRAGVLTPVLAMGDALFPRLERAGIRFARISE